MNPRLKRRALVLSILSLAYNVLEGLVAVWLGWLAGSIALIGFALDSLAESLSAAVMVWRFGHRRQMTEDEEDQVEGRAVVLVGWTFLILGGYVMYESLTKLFAHEPPSPSFWGMVMAAVSLVIMPGLAYWKRRLGEALGSRCLVADSKETLVCSWLSASLLAGLGLNYLWGLWWADPVVGLVIVFYLFREGYELLMGEAEGEGCGGCGTCPDAESGQEKESEDA